MAEPPLLDVSGLSIAYPTQSGWLQALDDVSLAIPVGGVLGLVGESGSGKSSVVLALLGLLGPGARVQARRAAFAGHDLLAHAAELRGRRIAVVFQDTAAALNPALSIGGQVIEPLMLHQRMPRPLAWARGTELLAEMGITRPAEVMRLYPHQLSGGMKQRVGIATALATEPDLLLLDEPTTALDVTVEAQILDLLDGLRVRRGLSMLLVSHNLGIVDRLCDQVAVLYAGRLAEAGPVRAVLDAPVHPYTKGLLAALPQPDRGHPARLLPIPGRLPNLAEPIPGCNFEPRCAFAAPGCQARQTLRGEGHVVSCHRAAEIGGLAWPADPAQAAAVSHGEGAAPLVQATGLSAQFSSGGMLGRLFGRRGRSVLAVDDVSLTIRVGEIVGLVGESGSGKSTLGRLLLRLTPARSGTLRFGDAVVAARPTTAFRRRAQIVFQNPGTALNPRQTVGTILRRPLHRFGLARGTAAAAEVGRLMELVRLPIAYAGRYPHQLSGGEQQRVGIARALASRPDFLVCDEAVSALDVSVQAAVLNLLADLRNSLGVAYLFISHDIGVIAHIADRVAVMYRGILVEEGPVRTVLAPPFHPYTELLLSSVPVIGRPRIPIAPTEGAAPDDTPGGCKFVGRCPRQIKPLCMTVPPPWQQAAAGHRIRCHVSPAMLATGLAGAD